MPSDQNQCESNECSPSERQVDELACNTPSCHGKELCIPVYYNSSGVQSGVGLHRSE